jgi:hypothetical protein
MRLAGRLRNIVRQYNNKKFATRLLICIAIGIVIVLLLPIVISLAVVIGIFILFRLLYKRKSNKVVVISSQNGRGGIFDLIFPILFSIFRGSSINENYYYCANCGTKHKETACPTCGSKFKKIIRN